MGLLLPFALGLLALAIPIIIFYMLKLRRRDHVVSSSLLWRRALLDRTANAPWQRLRRNLLLLLQLLLLILLVLVLARPFVLSDAPIEGNAVVVLDASASMRAVDAEGKSRWDRAVEEAGRLIDGLSGGSRMTLVWAGPNPSVASAPTGNKGALRSALASLRPSNGPGDLPSALILAAGSASQLGGATVAFISDGALPAASELPAMPGPALYLPVGGTGENMGITAFNLRDTPEGPEAFASVYNSGPMTGTALLSIRVNGALRDSRRVTVGPRSESGVVLGSLPLDARIAEATLTVEGVGDALGTDNSAWAVWRGTVGGEVLLVTEGNGFLEKGLNLLPGMRLSKAAPASYSPTDDYTLTVFDGTLPAQLPPGNLLLFAPPDSPLIPVSDTLELPQVGQVEANDPLLRFVDLQTLHVAGAVRIVPPAWARVLVRTREGDPLLIAGETEGRRVVAFAFDLHRSDLPLRVAFPILLANVVEWLRPAQSVDASATLRPGDAITLRLPPEATRATVTLPAGETVTLNNTGGGEASFAETDALGIYTVRQYAGDRQLGEEEPFAVNLFSREESAIAPREGAGLIGGSPTPSSGGERPVEIWPWILLAALLLLALEWWVYNRAGRLLPRRQGSTTGR
jgi:Ca-activated chloride channel homolog